MKTSTRSIVGLPSLKVLSVPISSLTMSFIFTPNTPDDRIWWDVQHDNLCIWDPNRRNLLLLTKFYCTMKLIRAPSQFFTAIFESLTGFHHYVVLQVCNSYSMVMIRRFRSWFSMRYTLSISHYCDYNYYYFTEKSLIVVVLARARFFLKNISKVFPSLSYVITCKTS